MVARRFLIGCKQVSYGNIERNGVAVVGSVDGCDGRDLRGWLAPTPGTALSDGSAGHPQPSATLTHIVSEPSSDGQRAARPDGLGEG
jgi:hypothetical protein